MTRKLLKSCINAHTAICRDITSSLKVILTYIRTTPARLRAIPASHSSIPTSRIAFSANLRAYSSQFYEIYNFSIYSHYGYISGTTLLIITKIGIGGKFRVLEIIKFSCPDVKGTKKYILSELYLEILYRSSPKFAHRWKIPSSWNDKIWVTQGIRWMSQKTIKYTLSDISVSKS